MESVGELGSPIGASSNLLSLPAPCPWDEDEESLGLEGIKPKSSPTPRRRSSVSSDDSQPPLSNSRRVSFADAFGLSLVSVKQFDAWGVTAPSGPLENDLNEDREYYMVPLFALPHTVEELTLRVHEQKLELESLELLSGTTTLRGTVRVLNVSFDKMVYVRTSLDSWRSHFDLLTEYVPGSNSGETDCFSFKLTLVPPFGEGGARVDFCLRYDTSVGTFWANNNEKNYSLICCEKTKEKPQNESENRRKSCLKASSSNFSASIVVATNNEELPDINLISGMATDPGSQNENSEKLEKEKKELVEEISRNHSRRNRRKAARLAKVKEHFAKREEERKQGTKTNESEFTAKAVVQEKTPCSPQSQQTARPPTDNQISPPPAETLNIADSTDNTSQVPAQHEEDNMINSKINLSTPHTDLPLDDSIGHDESSAHSDSNVLEDIQQTEDFTDQNLSLSQSLPVCQNPDLSICKNVERAWEHFEKDAKQRLKSLALSSKTHEDENISDEKRENNVSLKTNNTEPQPFSHGFTFGTIVAPLYHQVFKNMETERKDFMPKKLQVGRPFRELEDESLNAVSAPETTDIWPETCLSTKQTGHDISVGACKESTEQDSLITVNPTNNPLSQPNKGKCVKKADNSQNKNDYTGGYPREITFTETNLPKVTSREPDPPLGEISPVCTNELSFQGDPCHSLCLFPSQDSEHLVAINQTTESGIDSLPEQIYASLPTAVLKTSLSLENLTSCVKTEMSQNQEDAINIQTEEENTSVQTENSVSNSCILVQSPDDLTVPQTSGISLGFTGDKLDPGCSEMISDIEKPEECPFFATAMQTEPHTDLKDNEINMSTLESCQMNEKKEQMQSFSTQTSEKESISDLFEREHDTLVIKELEETHKIENDEEEVDNQKQDKEDKDQEIEEQEGAQEKHEDKRGINSIEDELKYIDDEEDLDAMETEMEKKNADADDLLPLERDYEEQKISSTCNVKSLPQHHTGINKTERLGGVEVLEKEDRHFNSGVKICEETSTSWQESSQKSDTELSNILENMERQVTDSMNKDLENAEDNTSTESLIDDEMELYLNSLRNSQQSVFREGTASGGYGKRPSISRGRPLAMPSISESVDEDQTNSSLEDLTNFDHIMGLENATDRNEHVIGRNVLWWKEFLSYDNMSRMTGYTFLLIVFLVAAYYYDFIACFALYLLTVYWLFHQGEGESLRNSRKSERGLR